MILRCLTSLFWRFQFKCPDKDCGADVILDDVFRKQVGFFVQSISLEWLISSVSIFFQENGQIEFSLLRCVNPNCKASPLNHIPYILNRLTQTLRKNIHRYYLVNPFIIHFTRVHCKRGKNSLFKFHSISKLTSFLNFRLQWYQH